MDKTGLTGHLSAALFLNLACLSSQSCFLLPMGFLQCSLFAAGANPPFPACCSGVSHCCGQGGWWYFCWYGKAVGSLPKLLRNTEIAGACVPLQHLCFLLWDREKGLVMTYSCRMKGTSVGFPHLFHGI